MCPLLTSAPVACAVLSRGYCVVALPTADAKPYRPTIAAPLRPSRRQSFTLSTLPHMITALGMLVGRFASLFDQSRQFFDGTAQPEKKQLRVGRPAHDSLKVTPPPSTTHTHTRARAQHLGKAFPRQMPLAV